MPKEGDVLSVDCGTLMKGFYGDSAYTFAVGEIAPEVADLLRVTKEALYKGVAQAKVGNRVGDVASAVQEHAERHGYSVVRELVGHGLGRKMHEEPEVPNYGARGRGPLLQRRGWSSASEPMINMGARYVVFRARRLDRTHQGPQAVGSLRVRGGGRERGPGRTDRLRCNRTSNKFVRLLWPSESCY
ncbi:MAG: M24 family metallopeptidase [Alistipes indistinctus]